MTPPSTIAHYRISGKLGEGGMGAVYRATDTRLNRDVAIKVLPESFANDAGRMARFEREAQVLASLNHPNIAAIYGIEQNAIVMELVDGAEVAGPVPVETARDYARQIAAALEAAHEKGIVHRDLKPANIKVTAEGVVKLLDFGLAKATTESPAETSATLSPTMSLAMTQAGMILGTAAYMSPEQARGKPVDKRADIWAFGVVLYEMLTGRQLFAAGDTATDIIAAVVTREPDWSALPAGTPANLRRLLEQCLRKDPKLRLRDIGDARLMLDEPAAAEAPVAAIPAAAPSRAILPWLLAGVLGVAALTAGVVAWRATRPVERPLSRFEVDLGPDSVAGAQITAAISPDGRRLVFPVKGSGGTVQLATRLLNESKATPLPGTEGGVQPFFSPDGQWIGFFASQQLKKISVQGGAAVSLCATTGSARGATWGSDGYIIANLGDLGLSRVPESGGKPEALGSPKEHGERSWRWPQAIPNGQVIFTANAGVLGSDFEDANIDILSLKTGKVKTVVRGGYWGRYLPSGHLAYVHRGTLFVVAFDLDRLETRGGPIPVLDDLASTPATGAGQLSFSATGTFVYLNGKAGDSNWTVKWLDADGKTEPLWTTPSAILSPKFSPDGKRLAGALDNRIVVYDAERAAAVIISPPGVLSRSCDWAPDGKHLAFSGTASGDELGIFWIRADGSGEPQKLFSRKTTSLRVTSFAPDGRHLAFWQANDAGVPEIWVLPLDLSDPDQPRAGEPELFLKESGPHAEPAFSPDGRWIAYTSFTPRSGPGSAVFVRPYPRKPGWGQWQVSNAGGGFSLWSRKGGKLYYLLQSGQIMVVDYQAKGETFTSTKPVRWSSATAIIPGPDMPVALAPDGKHFALYPSSNSGAANSGEASSSVHVTVLLNFFDELKRRAP